MKMDGLRKGEQVWVTTEASNGLELRREPTVNSRTVDEMDNVILSIPPGSRLVLEGVEVPTNDGHDWYKVRYIHEDIDATGWAVSDFLMIGPLIPVTGGASEMTEVDYKGDPKFDVAYLPSEPESLANGFVKYKLEGKTRQTSLDEWNAVAGPYYQIT